MMPIILSLPMAHLTVMVTRIRGGSGKFSSNDPATAIRSGRYMKANNGGD